MVIDHDSPKFIINIDVTFHEDALLDARNQVEKSKVSSSSDTTQVESDVQGRIQSASGSSRNSWDSQIVPEYIRVHL